MLELDRAPRSLPSCTQRSSESALRTLQKRFTPEKFRKGRFFFKWRVLFGTDLRVSFLA